MITDNQKEKALDEAYKNAGQNAYFGNGFLSGVEYAEGFYLKKVDGIKVKAKNSSELEHSITNILNVVTAICLKGLIPTNENRSYPQNSGLWWFKEMPQNRYNLVSRANDDWVYESNKTETEVTLTYRNRYDANGKKANIIYMVLAMSFDFVEII